MIHQIWFIMMALSMAYGCMRGTGGEMLQTALDGCGKALGLTVELCGGYMLFCGLMEIARALHVEKGMQRLLRPVQRWLMPHMKTAEAAGAVALNLAMNVLGMGNAATPLGLEAMRKLEAERMLRPDVRHDMEMFLILNATSLQLLPTTVLSLRAAAGSADVNAVLIPTIVCTGVSTAVGAACGLLCRWKEKRNEH